MERLYAAVKGATSQLDWVDRGCTRAGARADTDDIVLKVLRGYRVLIDMDPAGFRVRQVGDRAGVDRLVDTGKIFPIQNGLDIELIDMHPMQKTAKVRALPTRLELWVPLGAIEFSEK